MDHSIFFAISWGWALLKELRKDWWKDSWNRTSWGMRSELAAGSRNGQLFGTETLNTHDAIHNPRLRGRPRSPGRRLSWKVRYRTLNFLWFFSQMSKLIGLVLFCIDAKVCKKIFVGKLLTRSTRCTCTCFCNPQTLIFQKLYQGFSHFLAKFANI